MLFFLLLNLAVSSYLAYVIFHLVDWNYGSPRLWREKSCPHCRASDALAEMDALARITAERTRQAAAAHHEQVRFQPPSTFHD